MTKHEPYEKQDIRVTVDIVIITIIDQEPHLLLVKRKNNPYKDFWALPGGYINNNERLEDAAKRELLEETGLAVVGLEQVYILDDPNRDSRGRTISVVYSGATLYKEVVGGDDAAEAKWVMLCDINPNKLAFDHRKPLEYLKLI